MATYNQPETPSDPDLAFSFTLQVGGDCWVVLDLTQIDPEGCFGPLTRLCAESPEPVETWVGMEV